MRRFWPLCLALISLSSAAPLTAQSQRDGPVHPMAAPKQAPAGKHQANSFAPRPGAKRKVYGAPIQRPILRRVAPRKPPK